MKNILTSILSIIILLGFSPNSGSQDLDQDNAIGLEPPTNLQATVSGANVHLDWDAPAGGGSIEEELVYDNNVITDSYKYPGVVMSTRMTPAGECQLITIKYYTTRDGSDDQFNARVYNWEGSQPGTTVLYNTLQTALDEDWVVIDVSSDNIQLSEDFVVGFGSFTEEAFLGYDENLNNGRSWDYFESSETWDTYHETYLIRAVVRYPSGKTEVLGGKIPETVSFHKQNKRRSESKSFYRQVAPIINQLDRLMGLQGYAVYRDNVLINANPIPTTYFNDDQLTPGTYSYKVEAVYDEGNSDPAGPVEATISGSPLVPPGNLQGYSVDDQVRLWWESPGGGTEVELKYDDNVITESYKFPGVTMSTHFSPDDECELIKLKYLTIIDSNDNEFYARVFKWNGSQPGTSMLLNRSVQAANNWTEVIVEGYGLYFTGDFVVGFGSVSENTYLAFNENDNGRSWDYEESTQSWTSWNETYMIRAVVRYGDGTVAEIGAANATFQGYNLYRNGDKLNTELIQTSSYNDSPAEFGSYDYNVSAVYDEGESDWSLTETISYELGLAELTDIGVSIYPNPVNDKVNIRIQDGEISIRLFNMAGTEVYRRESISGDHSIHVGELSSGLYVLKLESKAGIATSKIVIN